MKLCELKEIIDPTMEVVILIDCHEFIDLRENWVGKGIFMDKTIVSIPGADYDLIKIRVER